MTRGVERARQFVDPTMMARHEQSREDLLAKATALVERIELALDGCRQHIVLGFRRDGSASIYFGEDPAYHFNSQGKLRRAYVEGRLLKAVHGRLVAMTREQTDCEVRLLSHELNVDETACVADNLTRRIVELAQHIDGEQYQVAGQVPATADVLTRGRSLLRNLAAGLSIAHIPNAK
jgi:hypothetical protein